MSETDEWYDRKVPEKFKDLVNKDFCIAFKNNLDRICKIDTKFKDTNTKLTYTNKYYYIEDTHEWGEALKFSCEKLKLDELYKYYKRLDFYQSGWFDDQLCIMLVEYGIIEKGNSEDEEYLAD